jgi:hypothetical protein
MAASTAAEKRRQARDAKQKKLLIALIPVLVVVLVVAVPRTLKQLRGDDSASAAAPAATTPAATGTATGTDPAQAPPADAAALAESSRKVLDDTDPRPEASEGQVIAFSRFEARDPFVQLVDDQQDTSTTDESGAVPGGTTTTPTTTTPTTTTPPPTTTTPPPDDGGTTTEVKVSVNGKVLVLEVGDTFPGDDPSFKLVAIGDGSIEIGLVSGSFATGVETVTVERGEPLTLISQPDGARYTIKLL